MISISSEKDRVILAFASRADTLMLSPDAARQFVGDVRKAARDCELWEKAGGQYELIRGEPRGASVRSWDGKVNVRLASVTDRESIPYAAARQLADEIATKIVEAENRVTIVWSHP